MRARAAGAGFDVAGAAVVVLLMTAFLLPVGDLVRSTVLVLGGLVAIGAVLVGVLRYRPTPSLTWWGMLTAAVAFLAGVVVRPLVVERSGLLHHLGDVFSLSGYTVLVVSLGWLVRHHGGLRREVVCDVLIAFLAGGAAALRLLVLPAVDPLGAFSAEAVLDAVYPVVDVVVLTLVVDLVLIAPHQRSHRVLSAAAVALLVGDAAYSRALALSELQPPLLVSAPFLLAYLLFGVAALHPSQGRAGPAPSTVPPRERTPDDAWSRPRLVCLLASLAAVVGLVTWPDPGGSAVLAITAPLVLAATFGLLVVRAVSAVNGQARARSVLRHRATHDDLTDLPTREEVTRRTVELHRRAEAAGQQLWLAFLDLDGFKRVNDTWGHGAGDELLRATARRLRELAPAPAVVGRLAGDEFVVVTAGSPAQVESFAARLLAALAAPLRLSAAEVVVTGSLGVALVGPGGAEDALRDADAAMYRSKRLGRNRWVVFDASMRSDAGEDLALELALRQASAAEEFELHYQPVVDTTDGRPLGVEALLRWDRPGTGPVPPVRFVPVLEDSGLIVDVGRQVLATALDQLQRWREAAVVDDGFTMSVNVSPRQLLDPAFADEVGTLLAARGLPGRALVLELTESSMLEGDERTVRLLHELRDLGVELAVDDFGTGYSALSYLRDLPVTRVKVDRSFVAGIGRSPRDEEVVRAVVAVSAALGLAVTAEGVETAQQRDALVAMGVTHGQGWLWSRARPAVDLTAAWAHPAAVAG